MTRVDELMALTFFEGRQPRSPEYRQGVRTVLEHRLEGAPWPETPYEVGTAQADAYFAGIDEGNTVFETT